VESSKQSLILLPGFLCDQTVWKQQIEGLADLADSVCMEWGPEHDSITGMAQAVLRSAPQRFALAGHSMGGRVAFQVYRLAPERVTKIAVFNTGADARPAGAAGEDPSPLFDRCGAVPWLCSDGTIVSTGAVVFAGTTIGARGIVGDQACIRERVTIGDDVVVGRGSLVENDTTIGALTKIQADAYVTAYSTLEDNVFIAPCVVTTNDNFMGRTERRYELMRGPTIRRGARVGGGAILCPGVEIGEEAFVGAGAVVTKDVPARKIVVGNPARVLRDVPEDELLPSDAS